MPTIYTDAIYSPTNLGVSASTFFGLSALSNTVVLASAGALGGSPVVGIAYDQASWGAGTSLGARSTVTLVPRLNGAASGDAPTTLTIGVSAGAGLPLAVLLKNRRAVNVTLLGGTSTYSIDVSASTTDVSDKNSRRLATLGYIG